MSSLFLLIDMLSLFCIRAMIEAQTSVSTTTCVVLCQKLQVSLVNKFLWKHAQGGCSEPRNPSEFDWSNVSLSSSYIILSPFWPCSSPNRNNTPGHCQGHSSPSSKQSSAQWLSMVVGARTRLLKQAARIASYLRLNDWLMTAKNLLTSRAFTSTKGEDSV